MKGYKLYRDYTSIIAIVMLQIIFSLFFSGRVFAEIIFAFNGSTKGWRALHGPVRYVKVPSIDGDGSLQFNAQLTGTGWSDNEVGSPEINRDLSGYKEIAIYIYLPANAPYGLKGQIFCKSGGNWLWADNGWTPLQPGEWTRLWIPTTRIADIRSVQSIGAKIGGNIAYNGTVNYDKVEILPKVAEGQKPKASNPSIKIIEIVPDSHIVGKIHGLDPSQYDQYKVVVYVKTDKWYIHPYERGGEGLSFASIKADGSWTIDTVKRKFLADEVAALIVKKDYSPPPQVEDLRQIKSIAKYVEPGEERL